MSSDTFRSGLSGVSSFIFKREIVFIIISYTKLRECQIEKSLRNLESKANLKSLMIPQWTNISSFTLPVDRIGKYSENMVSSIEKIKLLIKVWKNKSQQEVSLFITSNSREKTRKSKEIHSPNKQIESMKESFEIFYLKEKIASWNKLQKQTYKMNPFDCILLNF